MLTGKFKQRHHRARHAPARNRAPTHRVRAREYGVSLVEVLIAVLVLSVGVLGAASLQLNAMRYSASAGYSTQAAIISRDILDRMRANPSALASYATASISGACTASAGGASIVLADIADFTRAVTCQLPGADASIAVAGRRVTVSIAWSEARIRADAPDTVFVVSSVVR